MIDIKALSNFFGTDAIPEAWGNCFPLNAESMQVVTIAFVSRVPCLY